MQLVGDANHVAELTRIAESYGFSRVVVLIIKDQHPRARAALRAGHEARLGVPSLEIVEQLLDDFAEAPLVITSVPYRETIEARDDSVGLNLRPAVM